MRLHPPKRTPVPPPSAAPEKAEPRIVPVSGAAAEAVLAASVSLVAAPITMLLAIGAVAGVGEVDDVDDALVERVEGLRRMAAALAAATAAWLTGSPGAPEEAVLRRMAREHVEALRGVVPQELLEEDPFPERLEDLSKELLSETAAMLRIPALDRCDADLMLGDQHGRLVAVSWPATAAQSHVWLLGDLYERVEALVALDELASIEREASRWYFSRWHSARSRGDDFPRSVREHEFSLVERPYAALGASPVEHLLHEGLSDELAAKQKHMARQLVESIPGVWVVESRAGEDAVFRHPLDGTRYPVREHGGSGVGYGAGFVALGRLIPFGDGTWLRSPGTVAFSAAGDSPEFPRVLARGIADSGDETYLQVAVEGTISAVLGERKVPRDVRPDVAPDDAVELLQVLHQELREAGLVTYVDPAEVPEDMAGATSVFRLEVDEVLGEYVAALFELSKKSRAMRGTARRRERSARKKARKRGRR